MSLRWSYKESNSGKDLFIPDSWWMILDDGFEIQIPRSAFIHINTRVNGSETSIKQLQERMGEDGAPGSFFRIKNTNIHRAKASSNRLIPLRPTLPRDSSSFNTKQAFPVSRVRREEQLPRLAPSLRRFHNFTTSSSISSQQPDKKKLKLASPCNIPRLKRREEHTVVENYSEMFERIALKDPNFMRLTETSSTALSEKRTTESATPLQPEIKNSLRTVQTINAPENEIITLDINSRPNLSVEVKKEEYDADEFLANLAAKWTTKIPQKQQRRAGTVRTPAQVKPDMNPFTRPLSFRPKVVKQGDSTPCPKPIPKRKRSLTGSEMLGWINNLFQAVSLESGVMRN